MGWAAAVLVAALVLEGLSLRVAVREARAVDPHRSLWRFVRRSREPDVPAVLLEDVGAVAGALLGLLFLGAAAWSGDARWDAAGGFAVALLMLGIGGVLCVEFKSLLIGEPALPEDRAAIEAAISSHPRVRRIVALRTLHLAPDELLVLAQVDFDASLDFAGVARAVDEVQAAVRRAAPVSTTVHVEPELARRGHGACTDPDHVPDGVDPNGSGAES